MITLCKRLGLSLLLVLIACLCTADPLGIIKENHEEVLRLSSQDNFPLLSSKNLDHKKTKFYGICDKVTLRSYLWGYWNEKITEKEKYDHHTRIVEDAVNLGVSFIRLYKKDSSTTKGLREEIQEILLVIEDHENQRWCRGELRTSLFEFDGIMKSFLISLPKE